MSLPNLYALRTVTRGKVTSIRAGSRGRMADDEDGGLHPAHVYAFEQCGFLVTEDNRHLFDADDLSAWDHAVQAWFEAHPDTHPDTHPDGGA